MEGDQEVIRGGSGDIGKGADSKGKGQFTFYDQRKWLKWIQNRMTLQSCWLLHKVKSILATLNYVWHEIKSK